MVPKTCSLDGCEKKTRARGLCVIHYNSARLSGQFETTPRAPTRTICSFDGCGKKHLANGLCGAHNAQRRVGTPLRPAKTLGMPVEDRFNMYVDKSGECWEWTGYKSEKGYGKFDTTSAHRAAYQFAHGQIPDGAEVDHRCRNRGCVRPGHLRLTTRKQNMENVSARRDSRTGLRGVAYRESNGKWYAYVVHNQRNHFLGYYDTPEAASEAAVAKRLELFTHNELDKVANVAQG